MSRNKWKKTNNREKIQHNQELVLWKEQGKMRKDNKLPTSGLKEWSSVKILHQENNNIIL